MKDLTNALPFWAFGFVRFQHNYICTVYIERYTPSMRDSINEDHQ